MALHVTSRRGGRTAWTALWAVWAAVWAGVITGVHSAPYPYPYPDSPDTPAVPSAAAGNALGMLVLSPRQPIVVVAGGPGRSAGDIINYYLPVIMAEMEAPVSTRDPSVIRVAGCRQGYNEDQLGTCRSVFVPSTFYPRSSTRPNRQTSVASLLPVLRPRARIPRPQPVQTQRDLIRQFNTSRRRPSIFGRGLDPKKAALKKNSFGKSLFEDSSPEASSPESPEASSPEAGSPEATGTTTTNFSTPRTTTPDCDD